MSTSTVDFYKSGMILFDIGIAYEYENNLSRVVSHRLRKYCSDNGYRLSSMMRDEYEKRINMYSESDYWIEPGDPLVYIPDCPKWLYLKSRHIHTLRLQVLKRLRQSHR